MQTATAMVMINRETTLRKTGVTPAEVLILDSMFKNKAGEFVIKSAVFSGESPLNDAAEVARLKGKYKSKVVEKLWPGINKKLPQTFSEVGVKLAGEPKTVPVTEPEAAPVEEEIPVVEKAPKMKKSKLI